MLLGRGLVKWGEESELRVEAPRHPGVCAGGLLFVVDVTHPVSPWEIVSCPVDCIRPGQLERNLRCRATIQKSQKSNEHWM